MLKSSVLEQIQRPDFFLLTVILTIASRGDDTADNLAIHRGCCEHIQRLLLDVVFAQPWTQRSRIVEGLILLSEWPPYISPSQVTSEEPKSIFSEDRTAWSLIGLAVRHGYLMRLDEAAFRKGGQEEMDEETNNKRILWTCKFKY
jgi:hypothetical protein